MRSSGPLTFASVMATGIVSIAALHEGYRALSLALLAVGLAVWILLLLLGLVRRDREERRTEREAAEDSAHRFDLFALVAATAVLGTRLGFSAPAWVPLVAAVLAVAAWLAIGASWVLSGRVRARTEWPGSRLLAVVGTESLVVVGAAVLLHWRDGPLADLLLALLALGWTLYAVIAFFVARRLLRLRLGCFRPDDWILLGALAIASVAAHRLLVDATAVPALAPLRGGLVDAEVAAWAGALAWLPLLVLAELRRPVLAFRAARWSTVFPLGMLATATWDVGHVVDGLHALVAVSLAFFWVAFAVWALTGLGAASALFRGPR